MAIYTYKVCRVAVNHGGTTDSKVNDLAIDGWRVVSVCPDINLDYYLVTLEKGGGRR